MAILVHIKCSTIKDKVRQYGFLQGCHGRLHPANSFLPLYTYLEGTGSQDHLSLIVLHKLIVSSFLSVKHAASDQNGLS